ncbi:hypothetical protein E2542_SST14904 [Spatholobus suberectus]|nr:hypothetical protein E2542_SST14904 [Spatholobus suberectus]
MVLPLYRLRRERYAYQLLARFMPTHCHEMTTLLSCSYSEVGVFPHKYHINGVHCPFYPEVEEEGSPEGGRLLVLLKNMMNYSYMTFNMHNKHVVNNDAREFRSYKGILPNPHGCQHVQ